MMSDAAVGPYGVHYGSGDDLYKVFVKPFVDVVETAAGKTKEMSQRSQTLLRTAFEATATTLIPVLRDSYAEIFQKEREELDKVREEYADVYRSNWDAFKDNDVLVAAFMYAPEAFLTAQFVQAAPRAAARMVSVLSGGELDPWLRRIVGSSKGGPRTGFGGGEGPGVPMESRLREEHGRRRSLPELLSSRQLHQRLRQSPLVKRMAAQGRSIVRSTLKDAWKQAHAIATARSLEELQRLTGADLKLSSLNGIPQQDRAASERAILGGAKSSMLEFYMKNLEAQAQQARDAGIPRSSPYVVDYEQVISRIKAL